MSRRKRPITQHMATRLDKAKEAREVIGTISISGHNRTLRAPLSRRDEDRQAARDAIQLLQDTFL